MKQFCNDSTERLLRLIEKSPTAFQAVSTSASLLKEQGFVELREGDAWDLKPMGKYYVVRNGSSILAFRIPQKEANGFLISASHTDSPTFKVKPEQEAVVCDRYLRLNTEPYGGTIFSSWLDRPLSVAGRVVLHQNGRFVTKEVTVDRDLLLIPSVAIHCNRTVNTGYAFNAAVDLQPLFAAKEQKGALLRILAESLGVEVSQIVATDLFLYNRTPGTVWGADGEFFSCPRIDNLMCAFGTLEGFLSATSEKEITVWYAADNEETGSATKQGAGSVFLSDVLSRICEQFGYDKRRLLASSFMVSADNGHAMHPNHPELCDAKNVPHLNGGVVIKTNASQKYTTDAISYAIFAEVCRRAEVPVQKYANRSDMPGGSTLGSISNTLVPLNTVDIGMAQLAMHSSYETAGSRDYAYLVKAMHAFYTSVFTTTEDGAYLLSEQ